MESPSELLFCSYLLPGPEKSLSEMSKKLWIVKCIVDNLNYETEDVPEAGAGLPLQVTLICFEQQRETSMGTRKKIVGKSQGIYERQKSGLIAI